ncbi:MAG: hypothetical protein NUV84_01165 [Candidatus Uhrbacteria bacterium]|nr:hypothetical protein [Candidatus Uhrbacteria bacterium]
MPELSIPTNSSPSQSPSQTSHTTPASQAITLPPLGSPPDEKFLRLRDYEAGRTVILKIYATPNMTGDDKRDLWRSHEECGVNMIRLGHAAQTLERLGINWRQAKKPAEVLEVFLALPKGSIN